MAQLFPASGLCWCIPAGRGVPISFAPPLLLGHCARSIRFLARHLLRMIALSRFWVCRRLHQCAQPNKVMTPCFPSHVDIQPIVGETCRIQAIVRTQRARSAVSVPSVAAVSQPHTSHEPQQPHRWYGQNATLGTKTGSVPVEDIEPCIFNSVLTWSRYCTLHPPVHRPGLGNNAGLCKFKDHAQPCVVTYV